MAEDAPSSRRPEILQGPKGTRDFFPEEMARRLHVTDAWRAVSRRNGFVEVEGPTFELLDLYTIKSGEGIVSELFAFQDRGGRDLALRPEFTPTLARMVASRAASLPLPVKWFAVPTHYRAERPQRGRLREFLQWNVDFIGDASVQADVEVINTAIDLLAELGLTENDVRVRISHRQAVSRSLTALGVPEDRLPAAFTLLDRRDKMPREEFIASARTLGLSPDRLDSFESLSSATCEASQEWSEVLAALPVPEGADISDLQRLHEALHAAGTARWCTFDLGIVRGLAYYTGMVFEIHEASGAERAIAGGGRYDTLIETFGGPSLPACGFGMGDVVLSLVLEDRGLMPSAADLLGGADCFVISTGTPEAEDRLPGLLYSLRRSGLHARRSYKATRNVGKLMKEAATCRARFVVILGDELRDGKIALKNMQTGEQRLISLSGLAAAIRSDDD